MPSRRFLRSTLSALHDTLNRWVAVDRGEISGGSPMNIGREESWEWEGMERGRDAMLAYGWIR